MARGNADMGKTRLDSQSSFLRKQEPRGCKRRRLQPLGSRSPLRCGGNGERYVGCISPKGVMHRAPATNTGAVHYDLRPSGPYVPEPSELPHSAGLCLPCPACPSADPRCCRPSLFGHDNAKQAGRGFQVITHGRPFFRVAAEIVDQLVRSTCGTP